MTVNRGVRRDTPKILIEIDGSGIEDFRPRRPRDSGSYRRAGSQDLTTIDRVIRLPFQLPDKLRPSARWPEKLKSNREQPTQPRCFALAKHSEKEKRERRRKTAYGSEDKENLEIRIGGTRTLVLKLERSFTFLWLLLANP